MDTKVGHDHICNICDKHYANYNSWWKHNKRYHKNIPKKVTNPINVMENNIKKYICNICSKEFNHRQNKYEHEKICKNNKSKKINELTQLVDKQNELIKNEIELAKLKTEESKNQVKIKKENNIELLKNDNINNQLINLIVDKTKTIEELKTKINNSHIEINNNLQPKQYRTLKLNNVDVISRSEDNYINATQLCQAGDKLFTDWYLLESTNTIINELVIDMRIQISQLIDIKKGISNETQDEIWIHPDLAIQLAQWISPQFALYVSKWIRILFTNDIQLLEDKNKEIILKDTKIKLLQDLYIKRQQRKNYPERNVIYILTTEDNKKKRIYIIGKSIKLKKRLSNYNKTSEHEVVYYKSCKSEEDMNVIELMVINKLKEYREKANRDRFILPIEKDITFFTDIIDKSIEFY